MTRVYAAAFATETNTFAPLPTRRSHFDEWFYFAAGEHPCDGPNLFTAPLWFARRKAAEYEWTVIEGTCAGALPSGRIVRSDYEALRDLLLGEVQAALPLDIVLLGLHGAMAADGYDDCEGDLLSRLRQLVGAGCVIGVELDPHCHVSTAMIDASDLLLAFHEYPHTDSAERGEQLVDLCHRVQTGQLRPVTAFASAKMSAQFFTKQHPASELVGKMREYERAPEVLSASLGHSFASGDVADMDVVAWVTTDGDAALARRLADNVRDHAWSIRETSGTKRLGMAEAVERIRASGKLAILAEGADNPGGGAPGDSTVTIRALLEAKIGPFAAGPLWDPLAVEIAAARGAGARFPLRVGGKASDLSGAPLDLEVEVMKVTCDAGQDFGGARWPLGTVVGVRCGDLEIALVSVRNQALTPQVFELAGIDLSSKRAVIVKSNHHFRDAFSLLSDEIIYLDTPGVAVCDPTKATYSKVRRPLWPLDPADRARAAQQTIIKEFTR